MTGLGFCLSFSFASLLFRHGLSLLRRPFSLFPHTFKSHVTNFSAKKGPGVGERSILRSIFYFGFFCFLFQSWRLRGRGFKAQKHTRGIGQPSLCISCAYFIGTQHAASFSCLSSREVLVQTKQGRASRYPLQYIICIQAWFSWLFITRAIVHHQCENVVIFQSMSATLFLHLVILWVFFESFSSCLNFILVFLTWSFIPFHFQSRFLFLFLFFSFRFIYLFVWKKNLIIWMEKILTFQFSQRNIHITDWII